MLHAITQSKSTHYTRYLGYRDDGVKRVSEEDEITSIFLGPQDFMDADSVLQFWREVFSLHGRSDVITGISPTSYEFRLWPRRPDGMGGSVEPDAHLSFRFGDNQSLDILVEFKWNAPLSGTDQLQRQWRVYLTEEERRNCWHVFIAPETSDGINARKTDNAWEPHGGDRLILVSWLEIRDALVKCQGRSESLRRWAKKTGKFLEKIGVCRFNGFTVAQRQLPDSMVLCDWRFRDLRETFNGFCRAAKSVPNGGELFQSFFKE